ncbi:retrovirus-related pol polyprotein from transposon TNT 1-94 [Tanacetum coccineum]
MDDPNINMEEYIRLEEEKARRHGKVFNWETATYGKIWDNEDVHDLGSVKTEFPAIVFKDTLTSEATLSCEPTVSSLNDEIDFRISFDESDDEDCMHAKSAKKHKKQNIWKPTGHVFTEVGLKWKPTSRTFTIVGNSFPLTRITSANVVPPKKTTSHSVETQKPELKVYIKKPKNVKNVGSSQKAKVVQIVLWYLDSGCSKHMTGNRSQLMNFVSKFLVTVRFENDHIARIMGYGDYQLGNVTISRVYYVKGLGHNFFSVGQFCNADLEVSFQKNTCFIRNLEGVDLLFGSRDTNLYTISLDDMLKTSLIYLLSKASKTKSWLWHRRLSHLNFDNGTEFVNQTLCEFYENVGISNQTSVARTPQQNDIVERRNRTLVEAARTMLIFSKALLFLWAEAINTACYIQNPDWDRLFQPMFDEYFTYPSIVVSPVQEAAALRVVVLADSPVSTSIDKDAPSTSIPSTQELENYPKISQGFEELPKTPTFRDDPLHESLHEDSTSQGSSSNVRQTHSLFEHLGRWTKDHPIANLIGNPSRSVSMRKQLQTNAMWCYFDVFLTSIKLNNFKQAMTEPSWIDAMQE